MPEDATTRRQRRVQNAIVAIIESDDPPDIIRAELARVQAYLTRLWDELQVPPPKEA